MGSILAFLLVGIVGLHMFMELCHKRKRQFITISYANIGDNAAFYFVQATTVMIWY